MPRRITKAGDKSKPRMSFTPPTSVQEQYDPDDSLISPTPLVPNIPFGKSDEFFDIPLETNQDLQAEFKGVKEIAIEYLTFLEQAVARLEKLEGNLYRSSDEAFDRQQILSELKFELTHIKEHLNINSEQIAKMGPMNIKRQTQQISNDLRTLENIAGQLGSTYEHVNPKEAKQFMRKNDNILNVFLNKFVRFVHQAQSMLGFTKAEKQDIMADLMDLQAKHKPSNKLV